MKSIFQTTPENMGFINPTPDKISLVAGAPNLNSGGLSLNLCNKLVSNGFNLIAASIGNEPFITPSLNSCNQAGIKLFFFNNLLLSNPNRLLNGFTTREALAGWILDYNISPDQVQQTTMLNDGYNSILNYYTQYFVPENKRLPIFIGLNGDWDRDRDNNPLTDFTDYIADFQTNFKPSFWPFSYFPDIEEKLDQSKFANTAEFEAAKQKNKMDRIITFYKSLQYFAYVSRYTAAPFWAYCRCQGFNDLYNFEAAAPTLATMRGIVFSSLAYGAQGIYYWNCRQQNSNNYFMAPLDSAGNETDTMGYIRQINREVKNYNSIFYGCEPLNCRHYAKSGETKWLREMVYPVGPLMSVSCGELPSPGLLISHINKEGADYLVLVYNPFATVSKNFILNFSEYFEIYRMTVLGQSLAKQKITKYSYSATLNPGDYLIFYWE